MKQKWFFTLVIIAFALVAVYIWKASDFNEPTGPAAPGTQPDQNVVRLPIPSLAEDLDPSGGRAVFALTAQEGFSHFIQGKTTPTLGYNGSYLGPVLKVRAGEQVEINFSNDLPDSTSVHWHGLEVPGTEDGGPHQVIESRQTWNPVFLIDQPAATLWFHPHVMGTTATQVYQGMAGLILVEDDASRALNLPDDYGVNDIPLIVQDRSFNADGSFLYLDNMMDGAVGEYLMVNGAITPQLDVKQIKMRFRLVNGANASDYFFSLSDGRDLIQIASDGGLLPEPIALKEVVLSPGERAEVIIDFSEYETGETLDLMTGRERIMTFKIGSPAEDLTVIPERLTTIEPLDESLVTATKTIELDGMGHMVTLNGRKFDLHRIDDNVVVGETEIWEISTGRQMMMGSSGHPFHIHGTQFQILSRNGRKPPANEQGWKDTVFVGAGETVRIIVRFRYVGVYMYHCHILEHEEAGMMGQLEVLEQPLDGSDY